METESPAVVRFADEGHFNTYGAYDRFILNNSTRLRKATLTGLGPAHTYHYRICFVGNDKKISASMTESEIESLCASSDATADHTFRTLGDEAFTFIVYGDTRAQPPLYSEMDRHKLVADRIATEKDAVFVINTGDLVYDNTDEGNWTDFFNAGRRVLANKTYYPVPGNHDTGGSQFADIFGVPPYYSFESGGTRFAALDSNDNANYTAEASWLQNELSNSTGWKFVYFHHPPFTSEANHWGGWENIRESWHDILVRENVTAVFNGHIHAYERYVEDGVTYMVIATGGAPMYQLAEKKIPGYQTSLVNTLGYLKVTVSPDEVVMAFVMVAKVSPDGKSVEMYPPNTIFETIKITHAAEVDNNIKVSTR